jgi:hypothetical protein
MISREKADLIKSLADADGYIEPQTVIDEARKPRSLLHDDFDWDVDSAAHAHWIDTARRLIRFVKLEIVVQSRTISSVYYVKDPDRPARSKRYIDLTVAAQQRNLAHQILLDEMSRITSAVRRAQQVATVLGLRAQLDALLMDVEELVAEAEAATERARARRTKGKKSKTKTRRRETAEVRV